MICDDMFEALMNDTDVDTTENCEDGSWLDD